MHNNYGRLQDLILLFRIQMGSRKNFFEIYGQSGHAPTKCFVSPSLGLEFHTNTHFQVKR